MRRRAHPGGRGGGAAVTPAARRPGPAAHPEPGHQAIEFHGLVSTSFSYNLNRPASRTNQFRVFDYDDDAFRIDLVELVVQRPVTAPGDFGFRVDFTAGRGVEGRGLARPVPRHLGRGAGHRLPPGVRQLRRPRSAAGCASTPGSSSPVWATR